MTIATLGDVRSTTGGHSSQDQEIQGHAGAPRTSRGRAKSTVLTLAGIAGLLSVVWLIASLSFGLSVIVFKTGSMAPTMPTGAMAITRPITASDIRVGEVVTVPVPGKVLPVTHRVVSVAKDPADPTDRILVLKGDDNLTPDQVPYTVSGAKLVIFSVPYVGTALVLLRTPLFIAVIALIVAALVFWAFWPGAKPDGSDGSAGSAGSAGSDGSASSASSASSRRADETGRTGKKSQAAKPARPYLRHGGNQ